MSLLHDQASNTIQAMPIVEGKIGLTSSDGAGLVGTIIHCIADGAVTVTFETAGTESVNMVAGDDRSLPRGSSVLITSGTFDMA